MAHYVHVGKSTASWQEAVVAGAPDGVVLVGGDGRILALNPAAEQIFGLTAGEARGRSVQELVPWRLRKQHAAVMAEFFATAVSPRGMQERAPVPAVRANGEEFMAEIALIPVEAGGERQVACIVRDVTDQLRMQAALARGERLESLRVLSAGLAHDLNNILAAVTGNAEVALQLSGEDSLLREALEDIREAGRRGAAMVQQMLRFARGGELTCEPVDLAAAARETLQMLRGTIGAGVTARAELPDSPVMVMADPVAVRQVLMNLIINAAEAMEGCGGTMVVRPALRAVTLEELTRCLKGICKGICIGCGALQPGTYALIEVSDTGRGMDAATRERIFEPFFSTKFQGRGLGLAAVLGVAEAHGGAVSVESEPGEGTTFRVLLPAAEQGAPAP
ncbi:two-component system sensor histidine kinase NtrB [Tepidiforma bonchosmolovskayae]|nr:ATP-binding protein [Tepidiforma bonchosmolovskayae]